MEDARHADEEALGWRGKQSAFALESRDTKLQQCCRAAGGGGAARKHRTADRCYGGGGSTEVLEADASEQAGHGPSLQWHWLRP